MYIHLGENTVVIDKNIVGIFDLENTSTSKRTRDFLKMAQKSGKVVNVSYELPRSFIVCDENNKTKVYISQISAATLRKRINNSSLQELV